MLGNELWSTIQLQLMHHYFSDPATTDDDSGAPGVKAVINSVFLTTSLAVLVQQI